MSELVATSSTVSGHRPPHEDETPAPYFPHNGHTRPSPVGIPIRAVYISAPANRDYAAPTKEVRPGNDTARGAPSPSRPRNCPASGNPEISAAPSTAYAAAAQRMTAGTSHRQDLTSYQDLTSHQDPTSHHQDPPRRSWPRNSPLRVGLTIPKDPSSASSGSPRTAVFRDGSVPVRAPSASSPGGFSMHSTSASYPAPKKSTPVPNAAIMTTAPVTAASAILMMF